MKKIVLFLIFLLIPLSSCGLRNGETENEQLRITASLFPQYDFAKRIAGDKADVTLLLPPGTESHTFDPKPSDFTRIYRSDMFIYTGHYMEPWADKIISGMDSESLMIVDVSAGIDLITIEDNEENADHSDHNHEHEHEHERDPHIWLDLNNAIKIVDSVSNALCNLDSSNIEYYTKNAEALKEELRELDNEIFDMVKSSKRKVLVFGGKFAYIYFLNRYGIDYAAAYDSCSTETEPSIRKMAEIIDFIERNEIPCVYHEEFVDPKVSKSISEQTASDIELFSTLHNVTKEELDSGVSFVELMRQNIARVRKGLN